MIRSRTTSQKPSDEFYDAFKQTFPGLGSSSSAATTQAQRSNSLGETLTDAPRRYVEFLFDAFKRCHRRYNAERFFAR